MSPRAASRLAWSLWAVAILLSAGSAAFGLANRHVDRGPSDTVLVGISFMVVDLAFTTVGAVVASRQPRNPIGWMLIGMGLTTVGGLADGYASYALLNRPGSLPGGTFMAWLADFFISSPALLFGVFAFLFLLFPSGRLPGPRWRPVAWATLAVILVLQSLTVLRPGPLGGFPSILNPFGIPALASLEVLAGALFALLVVLIGAAALSLVRRFRRGQGVERQQLKWFVSAATFLAAVIASGPLWWGVIPGGEAAWPLLFAIALTSVPVACGIAILKYRLYDIDLVINKTLVYGVLAAFITAVYVGVVVGIGTFVGTRGEPNLGLQIGATALVAVAFQPVRSRVQRLANRLVYGERASPYEVLAGFAGRLGASYAIDDVLPRLARVVAEGTRAASASVWIRVEDRLRPAARWPSGGGGDPVPVPADEGIAIPGAERGLPVRHRGELLGALSVEKSAGDPVRPEEDRLLEDLAAQAGLVLRNVGLTEELRLRLEDLTLLARELRDSRRRIVSVGDAERRRLERDIHDGAQQHLVALAVQLKLARTVTAKDPDKARSLLEGLVRSTDETLRALRALARGIYPPLLEAEGLAAALEAEVARSPVPTEVSGDLPRFPPDIEAAAYFSILEALQNAAKYAEASRVEVRLAEEKSELAFAVTDDGRGFDPATTATGSGLQNMADRLAAVGGAVEVDSAPGRGTTVRGRIPARDREMAG